MTNIPSVQRQRTSLLELRLDALSAKHLHQTRVHQLRNRNLVVEFLTIAVPAFYLVLRFLAKATAWASSIEIAWELLAIILLVLAILRMVFKWQDREVRHAVMARRNADIANEALVLTNRSAMAQEGLDQFRRQCLDADAEDSELLGDVKKTEEQWAYRQALKEWTPGERSVCKVCGTDPWKTHSSRFGGLLGCDACGEINPQGQNSSATMHGVEILDSAPKARRSVVS